MQLNFDYLLIGLLYPSVCAACGNSLFKWENLVCTRCRRVVAHPHRDHEFERVLSYCFTIFFTVFWPFSSVTLTK